MSLDLSCYCILNPEVDLRPAVVKDKLERLVQMPTHIRRQLDRCFSMCFSEMLQTHALSEEGRVSYFTEDPQSEQFHLLALKPFCLLVMYAGSLGKLLQQTGAENSTKQKLLAVAETVFEYAEMSKPLPSFQRSDLVAASRTVTGVVMDYLTSPQD